MRYGRHPSLLGLELLNEPGWAVEWDHAQLLSYYSRALALVRAVSADALVVFNVRTAPLRRPRPAPPPTSPLCSFLAGPLLERLSRRLW